MSARPHALRVAKPAILAALPAGHAVIEASAGTGKTYTIEHLVVDLLLDERADLRLDQLLIVTFTEKATTELRERVRKVIDKLLARTSGDVSDEEADRPHWLIGDRERQRLERALLAFDSANISTIHSFCQRVLVEHAFAGRRLFAQEQVNGRVAFHAAFMEALRQELSCDVALAPWLEAALASGQSVEEIEALLWDCHRAHSPLRPRLDEEGLLEAARGFAEVDLPDEAALRAAKLGNGIENIVANVATLRALHAGEPRCLDIILASEALAYVANAKTLAKKFPELCEAAEALGGVAIPFAAALAQRFLPPVRERLVRRKREEGLFDFDDMIRLVRDSLADEEHGPELARRLGERFRVALIDEFQDTDEAQWEIFRRIFLENNPGKNRLIVVGDPKQAIYSFRGADVTVYHRACAELLDGARPARLPENYRSTEPMIDAYNVILDQRAPFFTGVKSAYAEPVRCGRPGKRIATQCGQPVVPIRLMSVAPDGRRITSGVARRQLAAFIAGEIRMLLDGARGLRFGDAGEERPIEPSDVYVLTRSAQDGYQVGAALREAGIPHAYYKQDGLYASDEADDILALLRAVCEPDDRELRMKAWLTPFFGVPLADLARCAETPGASELTRRLQRWKRLAERRRYHELFARVIDESGLVLREVFLSESERELTNYLHLFELLLEEAMRGGCTPRELVRWLQLRVVESQGEGGGDSSDEDVQRLESDKKAVQIMSMHKSKGLEAAVVFLYGGFGRKELDGKSVSTFHDEHGERVTWVGKYDEAVKARAEQERAEEDQRLLYVAMTRAKALLYLPYFVASDDNLRITGCYKPLNDRLRTLAPQLDAPALRSLIAVHDPPRERQHASPTAQPPPATWVPARPLAVADDTARFEALREHHAGYAMESYSSLKRNQARLGQGHARRGDEHAEVRHLGEPPTAASEPLPGGKDTGNSLHRAIEKLRFETLTETRGYEEWRALREVRTLFQASLARYGIDARHLPEAQRLVYATLTARLSLDDGRGYQTTIDGLGRTTRNLRELPFTYPIPEAHHPRLDRELRATAGGDPTFSVERGYLQGAIDFVFEHEGRCFLLDWKSDSRDGYQHAALTSHVAEHYAIQEQLYALAVVRLLGVRDEADYEARFGGILYCFLRGMARCDGGGAWYRRPTWSEVLAWERELCAFELPRAKDGEHASMVDEGDEPEAGMAPEAGAADDDADFESSEDLGVTVAPRGEEMQ